MKFLVLGVAFVALAVRSAEGQSCDSNKMSDCLTAYTNKLSQDSSIVQNQTLLCNTFQEYVDCILRDACRGVSLPDSVRDSLNTQLSSYGFNCDLDFTGGTGGAAGLANYYLIMFLAAALGTLLAL